MSEVQSVCCTFRYYLTIPDFEVSVKEGIRDDTVKG